MKTLSEIKAQLGIDRKTLQEYDRIGLLSPSNKAEIEAGSFVKWLYDDTAITKLQVISIFREIGYKRDEIKTILSDADSDPVVEFLKGKEKLIEKRKRIDAMASFLDMMIFFYQLPEYCVKYLFMPPSKIRDFEAVGIDSILEIGNKNYKDGQEILSNDTRTDFQYAILFLLLPLPQCYSPDSSEVQLYIENVLRYSIGKYIDNDERVNGELRESVIDSIMKEGKVSRMILNDVLSDLKDKELCEQLDEQIGKGSCKFVKKSISIYKKRIREDKKDES